MPGENGQQEKPQSEDTKDELPGTRSLLDINS